MTGLRLVSAVMLLATTAPALAAPLENPAPVVADAPPVARQPSTPPGTQPAIVNAPAVRRNGHTPGDPFEGFNRKMFSVHEKLDKAIYRPASMGYKHIVPKPLRDGIRNILSLLTEPFIAANFLLQGKPGKMAETVGRAVINATAGVGGLFDIAKRKGINLPHRENSLGDTLAIWGVGPGPYLFLPLFGPTTLRDFPAEIADETLLPGAIGHPFTTWQYQVATMGAQGLDMRAESDGELKALFGDSIDHYATLRSVWLQNRLAEINGLRHRHDNPARETPTELDTQLSDPAAGAPAAKATTPVPSDAPELTDPLDDPGAQQTPAPAATEATPVAPAASPPATQTEPAPHS